MKRPAALALAALVLSVATGWAASPLQAHHHTNDQVPAATQPEE
ncbi:hypothetical protein [Synechococcus sp. RSCCF101]|nr:hypothetical protein [Synechococcus sp. RSCCF101]